MEKKNKYKVEFNTVELSQHQAGELKAWLSHFNWTDKVEITKVHTITEHVRNTVWGGKTVRPHERRVPLKSELKQRPNSNERVNYPQRFNNQEEQEGRNS